LRRLLFLIVLAVAVRIYTAGWGGLSCDEAMCVNIATSTWRDLFRYVALDGNAPLIYVLLKGWSLMCGESDLAFRLFAVGAALILPPAAYLLTRKMVGSGPAFTFAVLTALSSPLVQFGNLARPYGLLPMLALACTCRLMDLLREPERRVNQALYALLLAMTVYLHHWGAVLAVGHALMIAFEVARKKLSRKEVVSWLQAAAGAFALYLPWLAVVFFQLRADVTPWIYPPPIGEFVFLTPVEAVSGYRAKPEWLHWFTHGMAFFLFWLGLLLPSRVERSPAAPDGFVTRRWQALTLAGYLSAWAVSQVRSLWRDRYLTTFTPILLLLYVVALERLLKRLPGKARAAAIVLPWLVVWLPQLHYFHTYPESSSWAVLEQIGRLADPRRDLVVSSFEAIAPQAARYLPPDIKVVSFPDLERVSVIVWAGIDARIRDDSRLKRLVSMMSSTLAGGGRVFLFESHHQYMKLPLDYPTEGLKYNNVDAMRMCQIRTWLEANARRDMEDIWAPGREFSVLASCFAAPERKREDGHKP